jgi:hypothetical protein
VTANKQRKNFKNIALKYMIKHYKLISQVVEIQPDNSIVKYTLQSNVSIEIIDKCKGTIKLTIQDVSSSTNDPANLYSGILVGDKNLLSGQVGYEGIGIIRDGNIFEFSQPGSINSQGETKTAYWQQGKLVRV